MHLFCLAVGFQVLESKRGLAACLLFSYFPIVLTSNNEGTCLVSVLEVSLLLLSWACPELAGELGMLHSRGMFNLDEKRLIFGA